MPGPSIEPIQGLSPDFQVAFQKAIQMERKPIDSLQAKKETVQSRLGLLNDVIGKVDGVKKILPEIASGNRLLELLVNSSNDRSVTGIAEKGKAIPGSHNLEVLQLATPASALSNGFADRNETKIGTGYLSITLANGEDREVFIDNDSATLDGLVRVINSARIGLRASVISDRSDPENPYRLMLTGEGMGAENSVEYPEFYFIDGDEDFFIDREKSAVNAKVRYQGLEIESPTNEVKDLIEGVTVNLRGLSEGPVTLNIDQDTPKTSGKVKSLVDNLNQVFTFIQSQNSLNEKSDTSKTLGGDYGIRTAEYRLREALQGISINGGDRTIRVLGDIGVQFNKNGTLTFEQERLEHALKNHFEEVADLLGGDGITTGVATRLARSLSTITGSQDTLLSSQRKSLNDRSDRIDKEIQSKEKIVERKTEALKQKLIRAQDAINSIQGQGMSMAAQLGGGGGGFPLK